MTPVAWNEEDPPVLPPLPWPRRVLGWLKLIVMALLTALALGLYALFKQIEKVLPRFTLRQNVQSLWARVAARMFGLRLTRVGRPMTQGGAMVSNHVSWSDIIVLRATARVNFVSKAEVRRWPGVGLIAAVADTVFIERRRTEAKRQEAELRARIETGQHLVFFPEATSTDGRRVLPFKSTLFSVFHSGALRDTVWVQPVTICYYPAPASGLDEKFFGWWGDMDFGPHMLALASHRHGGRAVVVYHPPVRAADFADRKALAQHCQAQVRAGLATHLPGGGATPADL
jgi:lyso-ornithine lipid O-acyltransferase